MSDIDALKDEIRKLNARATQKKMDLHDLSEELPQNWQSILTVAQETYDAFKILTEKRAALKALETA
nr:CCE_0567 family metalloprotein [uncultured Azospirillum sp.]